VLRREPRRVALIQAFAVDLTGQVVLDHPEGGTYGGLSTSVEFLHGAACAPGVKPIVCLPAASGDGAASNIRAALPQGATARVARGDVHFVATEHGVAQLFGKSLRERALALIEIAAPSHRAALLEGAKACVLSAAGQHIASLRPLPVEQERRLASGLLLRPARAGDAPALQALFHRRIVEDQYTRFFSRMRRLSLTEAARLCNVDHAQSVAFLAVSGPREAEEVVASGCSASSTRAATSPRSPTWSPPRGRGRASVPRCSGGSRSTPASAACAASPPRSRRTMPGCSGWPPAPTARCSWSATRTRCG